MRAAREHAFAFAARTRGRVALDGEGDALAVRGGFADEV
jgi:hypothetical protein